MKILIAEDEFVSRSILKAALTKWGHKVIETKDGKEAWAKFQEPDAPKLVILDWVIPEMEGIEVCRRIRKAETSYPAYIILLTSKDSMNDVVEGLEAGANDYISKPFDKDELRARVDVGRRVVELQAE